MSESFSVGSASGGNPQFVECEAQGKASSSGNNVDGVVGQTTGTGSRLALCRTFGAVSSTSYDVGV